MIASIKDIMLTMMAPIVEIRNKKKSRMLPRPMHFPTHGQ